MRGVGATTAREVGNRISWNGEAIMLAILTIPLAIALAALVYRSSLFIPINYNEGWNAYHSAAAVSGGPLYHPAAAPVTNNYPPLSFLAAGLLGKVIGDDVFAGRILAWVGFLGVTVLIATILRQLGNARVASAFGAMLFTAYSIVHFNVYVGVSDPQWLAHAIMLLGLWLWLRDPGLPSSSIAAGAVMACALFVKHNIVALPLALLLWLIVHDRRAASRFAAAGLGSAALGFLICSASYGPDFFIGLLAPRAYSIVDGYRHALIYLLPMQIPLAVAAWGAVALRDLHARFFLVYLGVAILIGCIQLTGAGVSMNAMFEVLIAFALAAGHAAGHASRGFRRWTIGVCAASLIITAGVEADRDVALVKPWLARQMLNDAETRRAIRLIAQHPGPAFCETPALCYWAGKNFEIDPFNYTQGVDAGTKDNAILMRKIASGDYGTVQLKPIIDRNMLSARLLDTVSAHYAAPIRFAQSSIWTIYESANPEPVVHGYR